MSEEAKPSKFTSKKPVKVDVKKGKIVEGADAEKAPKKEAKTPASFEKAMKSGGKAAKPAKKEKEAPAKKAAAPKEKKAKDAGAGRASPYAGKKIKVLNKKHGMREGTIRALLMDELINSKTTEEAMSKSVKVGGEKYALESWVLRIAIKQGIIELV